MLDANYAGDSDGLSDIANTTNYTGWSLDTETGLYYYRSLLRPPRFIERDKPVGVWCARRPLGLVRWERVAVARGTILRAQAAPDSCSPLPRDKLAHDRPIRLGQTSGPPRQNAENKRLVSGERGWG